MNTYIVQFRGYHGGRLVGLGPWRARSELGAIRQAAASLARMGEHVVEIVATLKEGE